MSRRKRNPNASGDVEVAFKVTQFWEQVDRRGKDECWPFIGYLDGDGYGKAYFEERMVGAHELALTFTTGERRPEGFDTCHSCHNPPCCNPFHLRFDTRLSNVRDMLNAGRHVRGKPLPAEVVQAVRARLAAGARQSDIVDQYGISKAVVSNIKTGKKYSYV